MEHINQVMIEPAQVIRKRHKEWSSFTVPLCVNCMRDCMPKLHIRYPVSAAGDEPCECPCQIKESHAA